MKTIGNPPQKTLFLDDLDLNNGATSTTAVFLPRSYVPSASPKALVYLHGFDSPPIAQYLSTATYALREETNRSDPTDLVFIAPSLGARSEAGDLVDKGLDWFLDQVLGRLEGTEALSGDSPTFSGVYLAAHSGGGRAMRRLAMEITRGLRETPQVVPAYPVAEYWLFDALYAPDPWNPSDKTRGANLRPEGHDDAVEEEWFEVVKTQPIKLVTYHATPGPTQRSSNLAYFVANPTVVQYSPATRRLAGTAVFIESTRTKSHPDVVRAYWKDAVAQRG